MTAMLAEFFASPESLAAAAARGGALVELVDRDHPARAGARRVQRRDRPAARRCVASSATAGADRERSGVPRRRASRRRRSTASSCSSPSPGLDAGRDARRPRSEDDSEARRHRRRLGRRAGRRARALGRRPSRHGARARRDADAGDATSRRSSSWDRRGSPQVRHSHAFLGRLYCLIRDHAPDLLAKLLACGAEELALHRHRAPRPCRTRPRSRATRTSCCSPAGASPSSTSCAATCSTRAASTSATAIEVTRPRRGA